MDLRSFSTCCLLLFASASQDPRPAELVLGQTHSTVTLPCVLADAQRPARTLLRRDLRWSWSGLGPERASLPLLMVASDGVVRRGRTGPAPRVGLRSGGPADFSLRLRRAQTSDAGRFHCLARLGARRLEQELELHLVRVISQSPGQVMEGKSLVLRCEISEDLPLAVVSWYRKGSQVRDSTRFGIIDDGRDLTFQRLEIEDAGVWECHVQYEGKSLRVPYELTLIGFSRPDSEPVTVYTSEGDTASLSLSLFPGSASTPGLSWGWLRQESDGTSHSLEGPGAPRVEIDEAGLQMTIGTVRQEDRGLYTGYLSLGEATLRRTVRLELIQVQASAKGPLSLGSSLRLEVASSGPDSFDGLSCRHENASGAEESTPARGEGAFLIPEVRPSDAGLWTCEVWLRGRAVGSLTYSLDVTELGKQGSSGPGPRPDRVTIVSVFSALLLLIAAAVCILLVRWKCRRRHFPALEVTLPSSELPPKKV